MSRIGKKPIAIPAGVDVRIEGQKVTVKGPKGELSRDVRPELTLQLDGGFLTLALRAHSKLAKSLWGLTRTLLANMIEGVTKGYEKRLSWEGVGYRAAQEGDFLVLNVGFSNPVKLRAPERILLQVDKNTIVVAGIDKEQVGQFAARVRKVRPPEPYKGKGIRYEGEFIRRKLGKKAVSSGG